MAKAELHEIIDRLQDEGSVVVIERDNGNWVFRASIGEDTVIEVQDSSFTVALKMLNAANEVFNA